MMKKKNKTKKTKYSSPKLSRKDVSPDTTHRNNTDMVMVRGSGEDYGFVKQPLISITTKAGGMPSKKHNKKMLSDVVNQPKHRLVATQQSSTPAHDNEYHYKVQRDNGRLQQYLTNDTQKSDPNYMLHMQSCSTTQESLAMTFYDDHVQERQSRSISRGRNNSRPKHESASRPDRSRSKSRDIVALYTSSHSLSRPTTPGLTNSDQHIPPYRRSRSYTPSGGLRSYKYEPGTEARENSKSMATLPQSNYFPALSNNRSTMQSSYGRSKSVACDTRSKSIEPLSRARSESRCSSRARDAISLCSNWSTQSRALSNSEIASQNLNLWISTSSRNQRKTSRQRKKEEEERPQENFVTLLEMDPKINQDLEVLLDNANSVKPGNVDMMMIAGHVPSEEWSSADEIEVKPGSIVTGLYKQAEWLFVRTKEGKRGFVPFAFTKAIRQEAISNIMSPSHSADTRPKQRNRHNFAKNEIFSPTYQNIGYKRGSISSENSVFLPEPIYSTVNRQQHSWSHSAIQPTRQGYADCIVVDTDYKYNLLPGEELPTYCSDSGISEPNSNHSDEARLLNNSGNCSTTGKTATRESVSSSTESTHLNTDRSRLTGHSANHSQGHVTHLPFGPLGARLLHTPQNIPNHKTHKSEIAPGPHLSVSQDMKARGAYNNIPEQLKPDIPKDYNGPRVRIVYPYQAEQPDDASVSTGEVVTILNGEDIEWIWVQKRDGSEGFIPREYVVPVVVSQAKAKQPSKHLVVAL